MKIDLLDAWLKHSPRVPAPSRLSRDHIPFLAFISQYPNSAGKAPAENCHQAVLNILVFKDVCSSVFKGQRGCEHSGLCRVNPVTQLHVEPDDHHLTLGGVAGSDCCPIFVLFH